MNLNRLLIGIAYLICAMIFWAAYGAGLSEYSVELFSGLTVIAFGATFFMLKGLENILLAEEAGSK